MIKSWFEILSTSFNDLRVINESRKYIFMLIVGFRVQGPYQWFILNLKNT